MVGGWGFAPDSAGEAYIPTIDEIHEHYTKSSHQMLPFQSKMQQNRWRLGLRPRPRWGNLHAIDEIHDTLLRIIAPDASIYVQNAPKSFCGWGSAPDPAGRSYNAPPVPLAVKGWDGDLVTTPVGVDFDMCPLACDQCPLAILRLATGLRRTCFCYPKMYQNSPTAIHNSNKFRE